VLGIVYLDFTGQLLSPLVVVVLGFL